MKFFAESMLSNMHFNTKLGNSKKNCQHSNGLTWQESHAKKTESRRPHNICKMKDWRMKMKTSQNITNFVQLKLCGSRNKSKECEAHNSQLLCKITQCFRHRNLPMSKNRNLEARHFVIPKTSQCKMLLTSHTLRVKKMLTHYNFIKTLQSVKQHSFFL